MRLYWFLLVSLILIVHLNDTYGQSPIAVNINNFVVGSRVASTAGSGEWERIIADNAYYTYQFNRENYGSGSKALPREYYKKSGNYNYGQQRDYSSPDEYSQNNQNVGIPFFEMRRYNGYYRDMEEWRKSERSKLKREGRYDREAIEYIYGIRPNF